ncbi:MAG: heme-binding domain-containing protein [Owenweeksia sp.]|nr:heme-binding domain-containing protein [Owenweeksia sp.]
MKRSRILLLIIILVVLLMQLVPGLPENTKEVAQDRFVAVHQVPAQVESILQNSCYDCHSNAASWPWYAHVAPVSYWLGNHVNEGREHLNFSEWGSYDASKRDHKLEELVEMIEEEEMPLPSYLWLHGEADLTAAQREALVDFAKSLRIKYQQ